MAQINLQRNSEVYLSTVNIDGGAVVTDMTPRNTWRIEVLAGYAFSQGAATQDITTAESGLTPDRSTQRFNTGINPVDWSFSTYIRPLGINMTIDNGAGSGMTSNVKPLADWMLWQALMSNTSPATGVGSSSSERSAWQASGGTSSAKFTQVNRVTSANIAAHNPNFAIASELYLYMKTDNIVYQITKATVNQGAVDAAIDGIATTNWSGFGTTMVELTSTKRNNAISVFGGVLNSGTSINANSNVQVQSGFQTAAFHPWASANVNGTTRTADFIKNRLTTIVVKHAASSVAAGVTYTFPVTALGFNYTNNITYLTPEELSALNTPIGQFTGSRTITGNFSAYLRVGSTESSTLLNNIVADTRTNSAQTANANLQIGSTTAPYFALNMPAVAFNFPTTSVEDVMGLSVEFLAQETTANKGSGDELEIHIGSS